MFNYFSSSNRAPLFYLRSWPVQAVTLFIALHCLGMIATALLVSFDQTAWIHLLSYNSTALWHGQIYQLVTYAFVNPPSIWFALEMMMLYYFGKEVEERLGSKKFALFYVGLILLGPLLLALLSLTGVTQHLAGSQAINIALFAAFVAIYPTLPFLFSIPARWMLVALLTLSGLQLLEAHQTTSFLVLMGEVLAAISVMAKEGYRDLLPLNVSFLSLLKKKASSTPHKQSQKNLGTAAAAPSSTHDGASLLGTCSTTSSFVPVLTRQFDPDLARKRGRSVDSGSDSTSSSARSSIPAIPLHIDALLEKISQTGMASLTQEEREQLEKASLALVERDRTTKK